MQLWSDYEGVTIDGAIRLQKLLLPEGRSAFFSTSGPKGEPTVVRLIECHFDEDEILARWRCVAALNHPQFLRFERYGKIELDGGPVVYAVFEKVDANLAEVVDEGHLTVKDVAQLAFSLVTALDVLHTHGFIHEHIEPRNIFAVGNVVKLRGDCIREAPEGEEGRAMKQRDVRDLAAVLLQALTQGHSLDGVPNYLVPPPFDQIIRNGLDGTWGIEGIRAALEGQLRSPRIAPKPLNVAPATPAAAEEKTPSISTKPSIRSAMQLSLPVIDKDLKAGFSGTSSRKDAWDETPGFSLRPDWVVAVGIVAALLVLSTWLLAHTWNKHRQKSTHAAAATSEPAVQPAKQIPTNSPPQPATAASQRSNLLPRNGSRAVWRVIVFTYDHKRDAEKKVSSLARSHPDLRPEVFAPRKHASYLVSIGGVMSRDAADALVRRARSLGLPRDTYAQNYSR